MSTQCATTNRLFQWRGPWHTQGVTSRRTKTQPRPDPKRSVTTETRLAHIAGLMRTLRWRRGVTGPQLAAEWGLTEQRVRTLAAEASKLVRAEIEDPNYVAVTLEMTLERIVLEGKDKDRIAAAKVWASLQPQRDSDADEGDESSPDAQLAIAKALVTALESKP